MHILIMNHRIAFSLSLAMHSYQQFRFTSLIKRSFFNHVSVAQIDTICNNRAFGAIKQMVSITTEMRIN